MKCPRCESKWIEKIAESVRKTGSFYRCNSCRTQWFQKLKKEDGKYVEKTNKIFKER